MSSYHCNITLLRIYWYLYIIPALSLAPHPVSYRYQLDIISGAHGGLPKQLPGTRDSPFIFLSFFSGASPGLEEDKFGNKEPRKNTRKILSLHLDSALSSLRPAAPGIYEGKRIFISTRNSWKKNRKHKYIKITELEIYCWGRLNIEHIILNYTISKNICNGWTDWQRRKKKEFQINGIGWRGRGEE